MQKKLQKKAQDEEKQKAEANKKIYVLNCKNCGYGYGYDSLSARDKDVKSRRYCVNCGKSVRFNNGFEMKISAFEENNKNTKTKWQDKLNEEKAAKGEKSKIAIVTGAILAGLAAISGFVISFLEEIKAFLAQASSLILEIVDIVSNFFSSIG